MSKTGRSALFRDPPIPGPRTEQTIRYANTETAGDLIVLKTMGLRQRGGRDYMSRLGMVVRSKILSSCLMAFVLQLGAGATVSSAQDKPSYGPWIPLNDGIYNGVDIAFKRYQDGTQYYKLKNTYPYAVTVNCQFRFNTNTGKSLTESACLATLKPGEERTDGGWWDGGAVSVDGASLVAKVKPASAADGANPKAKPRTLVFPGAPSEKDIDKGPEWKTYAVGLPLNLSDGAHDIRARMFQFSRHDAKLCPDIGANSRLAVFQNYATFHIIIANGVITSSQGNVGYQDFRGCTRSSK